MERVVDDMRFVSKADLSTLTFLLLIFALSPILNAQAVIHTTFGDSYLGGTGFTLTSSSALPFSPVSAINNSNAQNALWLLSCPNSPDLAPTGPTYFQNSPPSLVAPSGGNQCMNHPSSSTFDIQTSVTPSSSYYDGYTVRSEFSSTSTTNLMGIPFSSSISGDGLLAINALGFGAQVDNYVSDAFSQNVNVFGLPLLQNMHLLWSWVSDVPYIFGPKYLSYSPSACDKNGKNCLGSSAQKSSSGPYGTDVFTGDSSGDSTETVCNYPTYSYISTANVLNFGSTYIPYTELLGSSTASQSTFRTQILPYITYQISMPSLFGQSLNLQYYVFSPAKYHFPSNQLDALPISIGGQFFVNLNKPNGNQLVMGTEQSISNWDTSAPKNTLTSILSGTASSNAPFCRSLSLSEALVASGAGAFYDPNNPPPYPFPGIGGYLNSAYCNYCQNNPNGSMCTNAEYYQYLIDCTGHTYTAVIGDHGGAAELGNLDPTPAYCSPFTPVQSVKASIPNPISITSLPTDYTYVLYKTSSGSYGIDVLRTIPAGRYPAAPPSLPSTPDSNIWDAEWGQYWQQVIALQNDSMYLVSQITPSTSTFTPINMTVDYAGDIFLTGTYNQNGAIKPGIYEIPSSSSNQNAAAQAVATTSISAPGTPDQIMTEIAASPTGKYVYLANQTDGGYIYQYSVLVGSDGSTSFVPISQPINLAYQGPQSSTGQAQLNIAYWLENQGLYNQKLPFDLNSYLSSYAHPNGMETDAPVYHHPISIQDVNGYIYVLDNWAGGIDVANTNDNCVFDCTYQGLFFSMLNMRAIDTSNQELNLNVPINPTFFNDLFTTKTAQCVLSTPQGQINPTNCYAQGAITPTCVIQGSSTSDSSGCAAPIQTSCNLASPVKGSQGPQANGVSYLCTTSSTKATTYTALSSPTPFATVTYPPYGWIISANVMEATLVNSYGSDLYQVQSSPSTSYSICSASSGTQACNLNSANLNANGYTGTFAPIGPHIMALDQQAANAQFCFLVIFCSGASNDAIKYTGDIRGAFATHFYDTGFSIGFNQSLSLLFTTGTSQSYGGIVNEYPYTATNPNLYNALIFSTLSAQNYTRLFEGNSQLSCYADDPQIASSTGCTHLQSVMNMRAPLYNMPDPLKFVEDLAGGQGPTLTESVASSFPSSISTELGQCSVSDSQGVICNGVSVPGTVASSIAQGNSPNAALSQATGQLANVTITGEVFVPFDYTSAVTQSWSNFTGGTCVTTTKTVGPRQRVTITTKTQTNQRLGSPLISPPNYDSESHYSYATGPLFTNTIIVPIEGGTVYLQDLLNNYYQQNLSDIGLTISPQLIYNVQSNRQLADTMINITTNNLHGGNGNQYIINATHSLEYFINTYSQGGSPGYQIITSSPLAVSENGVNAAASIFTNRDPISTASPLSHLSFAASHYIGSNTIYSILTQDPSVANFFNFVIPMTDTLVSNLYLSNTTLQGSGASSYQALGYNRLIYLFRDRFNNTFFAPIDADISNPTQVSLNVNPTVDAINANKTALQISGTATYTINGQANPLPPGSSIYLYYGQDINFANYNPLTSPADAQSCAFLGTPTQATASKLSPTQLLSACALANPLSQSQSVVSIANTITYHPSYNGLGTGSAADCSPAPAALLTNSVYNCNINDPSTQSCPVNAQGNVQYCIPYSSDGSGVCSSQLGLIGIAQTSANGTFSFGASDNPMIVCGIGSATIDAVYYGSPSPQPTSVSQTSLVAASSPGSTCQNTNCLQTAVNNYFYSPNSKSLSVPIGLFELSYGQIGLALLAGALVIAMVVLLSKRNKSIYIKKRPIRAGRK